MIYGLIPQNDMIPVKKIKKTGYMLTTPDHVLWREWGDKICSSYIFLGAKIMSEKKTILITLKHYLPAFKAGGPVRSIEGFVLAFGPYYNIKIVTNDRDFDDPDPFQNIQLNYWVTNGQAEVFYLKNNFSQLFTLAKLLRTETYDLLYLNSFFDSKMSILPIFLRSLRLIPRKPVVVAPRGEFSIGALNIRYLKKNVYIKCFDYLRLFSGLCWQASTQYEKSDIQRVFNNLNSNDIFIAGDLSSASKNHRINKSVEAPKQKDDKLKLVFLSRIAQKKNLIYALTVVSNLEFNVEFDIYGPIEDESYWDLCVDIIDTMPNNIKVFYKGVLSHDQVISTLAHYDLFFLPTLGENYGHVVEEAIHAGLPILISDQTPWRNLRQIGIGEDLPLEKSQLFIDFLNEFYRYSPEQISRMKKHVLEQSEKIIESMDTINDNRFMIETILSRDEEQNYTL